MAALPLTSEGQRRVKLSHSTMLRAGARLALAAMVVVLHLGTAAAANRVALVIGNASYRDVEPLQTARADAAAMAKALQDVGFSVTLRLDVEDRALKAAVRLFKTQLSAGDEAVFYYAGHGVQLGAENYLVPIDIGIDDAEQVRDESLSLRRVLEDMQDVKARFSLAIIDACRNNPFRNRLRSSAPRGLLPVQTATGQMVIYSAGAGQTAIDRLGGRDRDPNGLFTRVLLKEISTPGVPVDRVLRRVRDQVVALARSVGHEQVPAIYDQTIGDFYFTPAERRDAQAFASASVPAPAPQAPANPAPVAQVPAVAPTQPAPQVQANKTDSALAAATAPATLPGAAVGIEARKAAVEARTANPDLAQQRLAALEKEQAGLKIGRALTILLEPLTPQERGWIATFEANVDRLRWKSAFALGPVVPGLGLQWGFIGNIDRQVNSDTRAIDDCGRNGHRQACRVVYASGRLDGPAFVAAVRAGIGNDLPGYQTAWRRSLSLIEKNRYFPVR
jgi:hypothetical protein